MNQQLFNIGMNLGLASNLPRQMDETNTNSLDNSREQPVLNIIYEHNKNLDSSGNAIFTSQFDSFDMSQITLQVNMLSTQENDMILEPKCQQQSMHTLIFHTDISLYKYKFQ